MFHAPLGVNWDFNYNMRISRGASLDPRSTTSDPDDPVNINEPPPGRIILYSGNGRRDFFEIHDRPDQISSADPVVFANEEFDSKIEYSFSSAPVYLVTADQTEYKFLPTHGAPAATGLGPLLPYGGRLDRITDRNGNTISFTYETSNGAERLATATDTLGHVITFEYHDDPASPIDSQIALDRRSFLLWKITDHAGRVVEYKYGTGNFLLHRAELTEVTLPAVVADANFPLAYSDGGGFVDHGRFPSGVTWQYEYVQGASSSFTFGLLSKITDPNGVDIIQNQYEPSAVQNVRSLGRVVRQQYGDEAYNYVVTNLDGDITWAGHALDGDDYYVWVNDRRGAMTRFLYSGNHPINGSTGSPGVTRHYQLLEKAEFLGFMGDPDDRVWAHCDAQGNPTAWMHFDTQGTPQPLASGPLTADGQPGAMLKTAFGPDRYWNGGSVTYPSGMKSEPTYQHHDFPPPTGEPTNPSYNKAMTSRTITSPNGVTPAISITEQWRYDFSFGGGGCGCGSSDFETAYKDGNGNVRFKTYDANGNMTAVYRGLPPGSSLQPTLAYAEANAASIDEYTYNQWGQVLTHTHPEKTVLDAQGAEVQHRRVDRYEYYPDTASAANRGRLHKRRIDVNGFDLMTTFEYDLIGNVIKETDPGGDVSEYVYNQLGQLVRKQYFDDASTLFAEILYFYDANGNIVVEEEKNLDGDQVPVSANPWFTTVHEYDKLDYRTATSREKNPTAGLFSGYLAGSNAAASQIANADYASERWTYDANRNLIAYQGGEAVNGNQPSNRIDHAYDARDLRIETVAGAGGIAPLKTVFEYDDNDLLIKRTVNPDGLPDARETTYEYDGIDRLSKITDPMGNETILAYDSNHNQVSVSLCGPIRQDDALGSEPQVTLAKSSSTFDTLDRVLTRTAHAFDYDYATGTGSACDIVPNGSLQQTVSAVYNNDSSIRSVQRPSGSGQTDRQDYYYDTASRMSEVVDGDGNLVEAEYDADSLISRIVGTDVSTAQPSVFEVFEADFEHDALDRRVATVDGVGNRTEWAYDSRHNPVGSVDARGNITRDVFDALGRWVGTERVMTDTGDGSGSQIAGADGLISESMQYDDSDRRTGETDDNGNTTAYGYDGLGRRTTLTMPDGAQYSSLYDANGNIATYTDARGVIVSQAFDLNDRLISRTIDNSALPDDGGLAAYVTTESYTYDGLGRVRVAENDFSRTAREYDSRSNVTREIQNIDAPLFPSPSDRAVAYGFDLANNTTEIAYPGGRRIHRAYDMINRLSGIYNDAAHTQPVTEFEYVGGRTAARVHGNGVRTDYAYNGYNGAVSDPADKGFGRVSSIKTTLASTGAVLDEFAFTWNETQSRATYDDLGSGMPDRRLRTFAYDSADRMITSDVDFPDPLASDPSPLNGGVTGYTLDGVHNRASVTGYGGAGTTPGGYTQTGPQAQNNQYSTAPRAAGGEWSLVYDANGNLIVRAQNTLADWNGDYQVNFFDINEYLVLYNAGDLAADLDGNGLINFFDINTFLTEFNALDGSDLEHHHYFYGSRNQLVRHTEELGATRLRAVDHRHDAMSRRAAELVDADGDGTTDASRQLVYGCAALWEAVEQIDLATAQTLTTHVFAAGIDDEVSYRIEDLATPEDYWAHRDDLGSITSLTDGSGVVVERYEHGDYGSTRVLDAAGVERGSSGYSVFHGYTGRPTLAGMSPPARNSHRALGADSLRCMDPRSCARHESGVVLVSTPAFRDATAPEQAGPIGQHRSEA